MHTEEHLLEQGRKVNYRQALFYQSVYLLSHRQGRCIALPVPVLPFVLHVVEGEPIEYQALVSVCPAYDSVFWILRIVIIRRFTFDRSISNPFSGIEYLPFSLKDIVKEHLKNCEHIQARQTRFIVVINFRKISFKHRGRFVMPP